MDDTPGQARAPGAEQCQHIPVGIPDMEHRRRPQGIGQLDLRLAHLPLDLPRTKIVIVVQADFSNGLGLSRGIPVRQMLQVSFPEAFGLMGMYAHHGHTSRMFRRKGHPMGGGRHIGANHRHAGHAVFRHALQYRVPVLVKHFLVHMAVGIEKRRHPMMAPSSTPS